MQNELDQQLKKATELRDYYQAKVEALEKLKANPVKLHVEPGPSCTSCE